MAPYSKLLYSSDGHSIPEHAWMGARRGREIVGKHARTRWSPTARSGPAAAEEAGAAILRENAWTLYRLDERVLDAATGLADFDARHPSLVRTLIHGTAPVPDADAVVRSLRPRALARAATDASRAMIRCQQEHLEHGASVAVETTLAGAANVRLDMLEGGEGGLVGPVWVGHAVVGARGGIVLYLGLQRARDIGHLGADRHKRGEIRGLHVGRYRRRSSTRPR